MDARPSPWLGTIRNGTRDIQNYGRRHCVTRDDVDLVISPEHKARFDITFCSALGPRIDDIAVIRNYGRRHCATRVDLVISPGHKARFDIAFCSALGPRIDDI